MKRIAIPFPATLAAAATLLCGVAAQAAESAPAPKKEEVSIPFVDMGHTIRNWQPDRDRGLYIQDLRRQWYYATVMPPCNNLDWATAIGFKTGPTSTLDRFSQIIVPGEPVSCQLTSLTRSDPPPPRKKKKSAQKPPATAPQAAPGEAAPAT